MYYQGENNCGGLHGNSGTASQPPSGYACMMPKLVELFRKVMMMLMMLTVLSYISLREHHCLPGLVGVAGDDRADGAVRNRLAVRARLGGREGHGVFPLGAASEKGTLSHRSWANCSLL